MTPPLRKGEVIFRSPDNEELICVLDDNNHPLLNNAPVSYDCRLPDDPNDPMIKGKEIFNKFGDMIDKAATVSDSSTQWISVTIIACAITITAVVIRWWIKKQHTNTLTYSHVYSSERNQVSPVSDQHFAISMSPFQPEVLLYQNPGETMERFFEDVARQKPIKFSAQDIKDFIGNPSLKLG